MSNEAECEVETTPQDFSKVSWWKVGILVAVASVLMTLPFVSPEFGFFGMYFVLIMIVVMRFIQLKSVIIRRSMFGSLCRRRN